jgi:hypothetical protein
MKVIRGGSVGQSGDEPGEDLVKFPGVSRGEPMAGPEDRLSLRQRHAARQPVQCGPETAGRGIAAKSTDGKPPSWALSDGWGDALDRICVSDRRPLMRGRVGPCVPPPRRPHAQAAPAVGSRAARHRSACRVPHRARQNPDHRAATARQHDPPMGPESRRRLQDHATPKSADDHRFLGCSARIGGEICGGASPRDSAAELGYRRQAIRWNEPRPPPGESSR